MEKLKNKKVIRRIVIAVIVFIVTYAGLTGYNMYQQYKKNKKLTEETMWTLGDFYLGQLITADEIKKTHNVIDVSYLKNRKYLEIRIQGEPSTKLTTSNDCLLEIYGKKVEGLQDVYSIIIIKESELCGELPIDDIVLDYYSRIKQLYQYLDNKQGIYTNSRQSAFYFVTNSRVVVMGDFKYFGYHRFLYEISDLDAIKIDFNKLVLLEK